MGTEAQKTIPQAGSGFADLLSQFDKMIGGQKSTTNQTSTSTPDATSLADSDMILQKIFADMNPQAIDAMVGNILERAKQTFGPAAIGANAAGVRAYSDTVLEQLKNEAMARATGEAAGAKLDALNKASSTAAQLTTARMNNTRTTTQTANTKAGSSTLGKISALLTAGSYGNELLKKIRKITPNSGMDDSELASGGEGVVNDANAFAGSNGDLTQAANTSAELASGGGADTFLPPASMFSSSAAAPAAGEMTAADATNMSNMAEGANLTPAAQITAADVLTPDPSTIAEILSAQGLAPGTAMPAAVPGAGTMPPAEQVLETPPGAGPTEGLTAEPLTDLSALDTGLPTAAELGTLSADAEAGLTGAGELSELGTAGATTEAAGAGGSAALVGEGTAAGGGEAVAAGAGAEGGLAAAGPYAAIGLIAYSVADMLFGSDEGIFRGEPSDRYASLDAFAASLGMTREDFDGITGGISGGGAATLANKV